MIPSAKPALDPRRRFRPIWTGVTLLVVLGLSIAAPYRAAAQSSQSAQASDSSSLNTDRDVSSQLETVIVTATKTKMDIQAVPASVQALTADTLNAISASDLDDIVGKLSGVSGYSSGEGRSNFNIRGIQTLDGGVTDSPTVGYYIDDTPLSAGAITPDVALFDLERVEVLKGPQGTLYGEGSLGGTIRLISKKPNLTTMEGQVFASGGSIKDGGTDYQGAGVISVPLVQDVLAMRVQGSYRQAGGFIDNVYLGLEDQNKSDTKFGKVAVLFAPLENFNAELSYSHQDVESSGVGLNYGYTSSGPVGNTATAQYKGLGGDKFDLLNLTLNDQVAGYTLLSSSSYYDRLRSGYEDAPELYSDVALLGLNVTQGVIENIRSHEQQLTEELRVVSPDSEPLRWVVGLYGKDRRLDFDVTETVPQLDAYLDTLGGPGTGNALAPGGVGFRAPEKQTNKEVALFGETTYDFTPSLKATLGTRVFDQTIDGQSLVLYPFYGIFNALAGTNYITNSGVFPTHERTARALFKGAIAYQIANDLHVYAQVSQGIRGGGLNARSQSDARVGPTGLVSAIPNSYNPDSTVNYEVGFKSEWLDRRLLTNVAIYHIDWKNVQTDFANAAENISYIENAGKARVNGLEIEIVGKPMPGLEIGGNATFMNSQTVGEFSDNGITVASGTKLPEIPEFKSNLYVSYDRPIYGALSSWSRLDYEHIGARYNAIQTTEPVSSSGAIDLPSYNTVTLRSGVRFKGLTVDAYGSNLFNKRGYLDYNVIRGGYTVTRPQTIGLELREQF